MVGPPSTSSFWLEEAAMPEPSGHRSEHSTASLVRGSPQAASEEGSSAGCLLRLIWMGPGNIVLLFLAASISRMPSWSFSFWDVGFWLTVPALIAIRYLDVARFEGLTANGEPASRRDVRRYAVGLGLVALALWLAAQSVQM
jgi:hypothetical protein